MIVQHSDSLPGLSENNLSLYAWFKSNPEKNNRLLYPRWRSGVPTVLLKYASVWHDVFVGNEEQHPGDGVLYFHDFLLGDKFFSDFYNGKSIKPKNIPVYALLFNYWYSFSAEKNGTLTMEPERVLTLVLSGNPRLAIPLYEYRRQIDLELFTKFISKILQKWNLSINNLSQNYGNNDVCEAVEHWLWEAILGFSFPRLLGDWQNRLLNLWAGYTPEAVKRFVILHLPTERSIISPRELREYLTAAESLYLETKSLAGCYSVALVGECRVPKMSSIGMMQRFHDAEHIDQLRKQISHDKAVYEWPLALTNILSDFPEWYIPTMNAEVNLRGTQHNHCVGSYADHHFEPPIENKTLLLFSDLYKAEMLIYFENKISTNVTVIQVRGYYNKDAPADTSNCVNEIAKKLEKLSVDAFCPKRVNMDVVGKNE